MIDDTALEYLRFSTADDEQLFCFGLGFCDIDTISFIERSGVVLQAITYFIRRTLEQVIMLLPKTAAIAIILEFISDCLMYLL